MKNGNVHLKMSALRFNLQTCIVVGLCCYVTMLSVVTLTHEHIAHAYSEETCTVCFYNSQQVGVELGSVALINPFLSSASLLLYESIFLPLKLTTNTRSRAPPVFSNELSIAVC